MYKWLLGLLSGGPYYLRVNRQRLSIKDISSGRAFECRAVVGMDSAGKVTAIGDAPGTASVKQVNPFDHPRILVHDYPVAEILFRHAIRQVSGMSFFSPAPVLVVQPDLVLEGGLTSIESRVLRELADSAGARKTYIIHRSQPLSDDEVRRTLDSIQE